MSWTRSGKAPIGRLTERQREIVYVLKSGIDLKVEIKDGAFHPYWADGRKLPRTTSISCRSLVKKGWLREVTNELGGVLEYKLT